MHKALSSVRAVGFDLDRTLYFETAAMQRRIADKVIERILEIRPGLNALKNIRKILEEKCQMLQSWTKVIESVGIGNSEEVMMACLASANIADLIEEDRRLIRVMELLSQKYFLFLITGSSREFGIAKLKKIGINPSIFQFSLFGNDNGFVSKTSPDNFINLLSRSSYAPHEHIYIGDNLLTDIIIPKSIGIRTVLVGSIASEADFCIETVHEIEGLLL